MLMFSVLKTVAIKSYSEVAEYFILVITFKHVEPKEIENWFLFWYAYHSFQKRKGYTDFGTFILIIVS